MIGDTLHSRDDHGRYCTHTALARQLDEWFAEFDHIVIAAMLAPGAVLTGFSPYEHQHITFVPLSPAGGTGVRAKLGALVAAISWTRVVIPLLRRADAVHLRAPCNVTLIAIPLARLLARNRYAIYAGAWDPPPGTPLSYRLQRWMLRRFGGVVHVYAPAGSTGGTNLRPNFSPSFTAARLEELGEAADRRLAGIRASPPTTRPLRVCCVGRFSANKNQAGLVEACALLRNDSVEVEVRFAGEGPTEADVRARTHHLDLDASVTFLGRCAEPALEDLYEWADVNVMPSHVEGFGRVILEGMALGCPAICGPGAMQAEMIGHGTRGRQVDRSEPEDLARALVAIRQQSVDEWSMTAQACRTFARSTTIEAFGDSVRSIVHVAWGFSPATVTEGPSATHPPARPGPG